MGLTCSASSTSTSLPSTIRLSPYCSSHPSPFASRGGRRSSVSWSCSLSPFGFESRSRGNGAGGGGDSASFGSGAYGRRRGEEG